MEEWSCFALSALSFSLLSLLLSHSSKNRSEVFSLLSFSLSSTFNTMCSVQMSQDELRKAIVGIQMDATIDEAEKAARRQALLTGKWKPGDGKFFLFRCIDSIGSAESRPPLSLSSWCSSSFRPCLSPRSASFSRRMMRSRSPLLPRVKRKERKRAGESWRALTKKGIVVFSFVVPSTTTFSKSVAEEALHQKK